MDLRRIETFRLVALHGSLRHAANHFALTMRAVSIQIKTLEQESGIELFHRLPNKLVLTDRGRLFLTELAKIVAAIRHATDASQARNCPKARFRSRSDGDLTQYFAPAIAQSFRAMPAQSYRWLRPPRFVDCRCCLTARSTSVWDSIMALRKDCFATSFSTQGCHCLRSAPFRHRHQPRGSEKPFETSHHDDADFAHPQADR